MLGTEGRSGAGDLLAYLDLPGKPRCYVKRIDARWHSWTNDPRDAHRFATAAEADALLEEWAPAAPDLVGTVAAEHAVRAFNRAAKKAAR